ncbi:MAG: hypothetical protein ACE5DL_03895 [Nitrosopumilaceae archaeon]
MTRKTQNEINESKLELEDLIVHFREKCKVCGHHRIMHDSSGKCEGVMNKPCNSGCDEFDPE